MFSSAEITSGLKSNLSRARPPHREDLPESRFDTGRVASSGNFLPGNKFLCQRNELRGFAVLQQFDVGVVFPEGIGFVQGSGKLVQVVLEVVLAGIFQQKLFRLDIPRQVLPAIIINVSGILGMLANQLDNPLGLFISGFVNLLFMLEQFQFVFEADLRKLRDFLAGVAHAQIQFPGFFHVFRVVAIRRAFVF